MPLERAISEFRFAYGVDAEARKMRQPPGTLALDSMPKALVDMFRRAFLSTNRPQPREWIEQLDALARALKKCDMHSGHYYYCELRYCPWCAIERQARVRLFNFLLSGDDSRRGPFRLDEIWKEIASVNSPDSSLNRWERMLIPPEPSADVAIHARKSRNRFYLTLVFSIFAGVMIPSFVDGEGIPAFFLLILSGLASCAIGNTAWYVKALSRFQRRHAIPDDPLLKKVQTRWQKAKERAYLLKEQYDRETKKELLGAKLDELRNRKETYENLAQIREFRFHRLEAEAIKNQLDEFLNQFKIADAEISGVVAPVKAALLSQGVETAADVAEEVERLASIGRSQAQRLLEWRRDLEQKFVLNPARTIPQEIRIKTEKEVDALRIRLESELIGGVHYLRRLKQEIETSRETLQPALNQAHQAFVQAEKDLEVARKGNSTATVIIAMLIAFFVSMTIYSLLKPTVQYIADPVVETSSNDPSNPPPIVSGPRDSEFYEQNKRREAQEALNSYRKGLKLSRDKKFAGAVNHFQEAVRIDSQFYDAYEELGDALYRLGRYEESAYASRTASSLRPTFRSFYNLGLARFATKDWSEVILAFQNSIELRNPSSWKDEYTQAYYHLGLSLAKAGQIHKAIQELEAEPGFLDGVPINRFKLATLYLCAGWTEAAKDQHRLLKNSDQTLAWELNKLIKKHGKAT
jgi:tetratricopeptide (TPR) repeat protein